MCQMMIMFYRFLMIMVLCMWILPTQARVHLMDIRIGTHDGYTRLVFEMSGDTAYQIYTLKSPYQVVIDFPKMDWNRKISKPAGLITHIALQSISQDKSRFVIDVRGSVKILKHFMISQSSQYPARLVVDIQPMMTVQRQEKLETQEILSDNFYLYSVLFPQPRPKMLKKIIIIDPGHGGNDSGALGSRTREKHVVFSFSKALAKKLNETGRYQVYLTRNKDIYISLKERVQMARRKKADLFISIHADAIKKKNIRGFSIYTLSEKASDKEAAALAARENKSDIIAGVDFVDQSKEVTDILIDLAQRETKNMSVKFARYVVNTVKGKIKTLENPHRFAGFRVLKAPDIPSILIELGFITNRQDEKYLRSPTWQRKLSTYIVVAIDTFFSDEYSMNIN